MGESWPVKIRVSGREVHLTVEEAAALARDISEQIDELDQDVVMSEFADMCKCCGECGRGICAGVMQGGFCENECFCPVDDEFYDSEDMDDDYMEVSNE